MGSFSIFPSTGRKKGIGIRTICLLPMLLAVFMLASCVSSPRSSSTPSSSLNGVAAFSTKDAWAVGTFSSLEGAQVLIEHWDGRSWRDISPHMHGVLYAVTVIAPDDVWAVGNAPADASAAIMNESRLTLTLHWNGSHWGKVASPSPGDFRNSLTSISALSSNDIWAVGVSETERMSPRSAALIEHWDGKSWSLVDTAASHFFSVLNSVLTLSPTNIWTVGQGSTKSTRDPLVEHWDGQTWRILPITGYDSAVHLFNADSLRAVTLLVNNTILAIGDFAHCGLCVQGLKGHWDGDGPYWNVLENVNTTRLGSVTFASVLTPRASHIWVVGDTHNNHSINFSCFIAHWDEAGWHILPAPNPGIYCFLKGLAAVSATDMWAVGNSRTGGDVQVKRTLVEHWDGTRWQIVASPSPAVDGTPYPHG